MGVQSIVGANGDQKLSYDSEGLAGYDHGAASGALQNLVALKGNGLLLTSCTLKK